jgi:hypothetical protein
VSRQLGVRVSRATLEALNDAGFIGFSASKPLALPRSREVEKDLKQKQNPAMPAVASYEGSRQASYPQVEEPVENPWALR